MKNIFKLFSLMLIAGTLMVSCKPDDPSTPDTPATPTKYTVQVNSNDATLGTASISPLKTTYTEGDTVILTATPADGAKFLNWNGNITENPYTYVVKENITFTANFEALPQPAYAVTFNGTALDVAGFHTAMTDGADLWLFQAATSAEPNPTGQGYLVHFPFLALWMQGANSNDLTVLNRTELYKDTYYQAGQNQYGDWQFKSLDNMNCTALDMTTHTMSMSASMTMYDLGPIVDGTAATADECPTATLAVTLNNMVFEIASKSLAKFQVK